MTYVRHFGSLSSNVFSCQDGNTCLMTSHVHPERSGDKVFQMSTFKPAKVHFLHVNPVSMEDLQGSFSLESLPVPPEMTSPSLSWQPPHQRGKEAPGCLTPACMGFILLDHSRWIRICSQLPIQLLGDSCCVSRNTEQGVFGALQTLTSAQLLEGLLWSSFLQLFPSWKKGEQDSQNRSPEMPVTGIFPPSVFRTSSVAVWVNSLLWGLDRTEPHFRPHAYLWGAYWF